MNTITSEDLLIVIFSILGLVFLLFQVKMFLDIASIKKELTLIKPSWQRYQLLSRMKMLRGGKNAAIEDLCNYASLVYYDDKMSRREKEKRLAEIYADLSSFADEKTVSFIKELIKSSKY
jgi:hypothetical protein